MTIPRQLITVAVEYGKALSLLDEKQDATAYRKERILSAAEEAIRPLLQEWLETILCNYENDH